ncbi:hypothetical protein TTHERM_000582346 (macronuclear) [Tetrahymena thermophila SB210]|uniref:Uncharacterized protein n=1 Tax=Tetrahymena thermophila (strain SB210) TaxID=312017 RepID=W7XIW7_TETTS|nr:hypothetical protein TTHERM_000582346 [Tetrahymena thermophila SB210]EWS73659.1 hypothetical protein TTHERM_000582346 [Tetrahymena thermophila SB210]|eukprot:XP_012653789.1 hypothetical protein TTHERM_000582346 [Tetrahymena thermophila SB210]
MSQQTFFIKIIKKSSCKELQDINFKKKPKKTSKLNTLLTKARTEGIVGY